MYDVIIVGAGPSGSSAARRCAQLGMNTLLIDKAIFPRDKLCGGGLSEQAISYLDFELPHEIIEREIYGARVHFRDTYTEIRKSYRIAVTISRTDFDNFLIKKSTEAGANVLEGKRVSALEIDNNCVEVIAGKDKYLGRIVIGADGFNSIVAKHVRRGHSKSEYGICMESKIPKDDAAIDTYINKAMDIHFNIAHGGYGWVFPHRGYFSVGIGGLASRLTNPREVMKSFLTSVGFSLDVDMKGYPIPAGGVRRNIVTQHIMLTGDAAGFVDTFYGEGLAYAIRSGQLAAETANEALRDKNNSAQRLNRFSIQCEQEFGKDLRYSLYFSRLMHRFPNVFFRLMATERQVLDKFLEVPARKRSYQSYLRWLLPRVPLFLARQAVRL